MDPHFALRQNCSIFEGFIFPYPWPPPPYTYLPTPLQPAYLASPPPHAYHISGMPPPTNHFDEIERVRRMTQAAAKKRQRAARAARLQAANDQAAKDRAAAAAYTPSPAQKRTDEPMNQMEAAAAAEAAKAEAKAAAEEKAAAEAKGAEEAEAAAEETEPQDGPMEMVEAVGEVETAGTAEVGLSLLPVEIHAEIIRQMVLSPLKGVWTTLSMSRYWHQLTVRQALQLPRPEGRQPHAVNIGADAACGICGDPFSSLCRPTVMLSCSRPHVHCWECIAKHSLGNSETTCDGLVVSCPICRICSSGLQVCGMAGGLAGMGMSRVLLPGDVVGFADIRRKQLGRKERDREEGMEAERRDRAAFEALQQALATAQPPVEVDVWWCTMGAEVAVLSGSCEPRQLQGLANHVGTLSARQVSVSSEVLSLASDDILRRCMGVEERTADVVHRELQRRALEGRLRVTAATAQTVIDRRMVGIGGKRVRTQTPAFIPYS
jgi:chemotaxis protein histidine kinase CheA